MRVINTFNASFSNYTFIFPPTSSFRLFAHSKSLDHFFSFAKTHPSFVRLLRSENKIQKVKDQFACLCADCHLDRTRELMKAVGEIKKAIRRECK